jgi:hypothetical protein
MWAGHIPSGSNSVPLGPTWVTRCAPSSAPFNCAPADSSDSYPDRLLPQGAVDQGLPLADPVAHGLELGARTAFRPSTTGAAEESVATCPPGFARLIWGAREPDSPRRRAVSSEPGSDARDAGAIVCCHGCCQTDQFLVRAKAKGTHLQGFLSAPERIRTSTTYSGHKALNLVTQGLELTYVSVCRDVQRRLTIWEQIAKRLLSRLLSRRRIRSVLLVP